MSRPPQPVIEFKKDILVESSWVPLVNRGPALSGDVPEGEAGDRAWRSAAGRRDPDRGHACLPAEARRQDGRRRAVEARARDPCRGPRDATRVEVEAAVPPDRRLEAGDARRPAGEVGDDEGRRAAAQISLGEDAVRSDPYVRVVPVRSDDPERERPAGP